MHKSYICMHRFFLEGEGSSKAKIFISLHLICLKIVFFSVKLMEPASLSNRFEIPTVVACRLAGRKCGNFKTG